ncbi:MAG: hypothetical protein ACLFV7_13815 [Phycisphaerae bacterium]
MQRFHIQFQLPGRGAPLWQRVVGGITGAILGVLSLIAAAVIAVIALPVGLIAAWLVKRKVRRGMEEFQQRMNEAMGRAGEQSASPRQQPTGPGGRKKVDVRVVDPEEKPDA